MFYKLLSGALPLGDVIISAGIFSFTMLEFGISAVLSVFTNQISSLKTFSLSFALIFSSVATSFSTKLLLLRQLNLTELRSFTNNSETYLHCYRVLTCGV